MTCITIYPFVAEQRWWNKRKKHYRDKYLAKHNAVFDQLDVVTYEEVRFIPQHSVRL